MEKIALDFRPEITSTALNRLEEIAKDTEEGQELSVILERTDAHQADEILEILRENNYDCQTKGGHKENFFINGKKKDN